MRNNGLVVTKHDITKTINEVLLREGWFNHEDPYKKAVEGFKNVLAKIAKKDKELMLYCKAKSIDINENRDEFLKLSSYLLSTAQSCEYPHVVAIKENLNDDLVRTCCHNIIDTFKHKNLFNTSLAILKQLGMGNKYIACNMWKLLTNENYKPTDERMPRLEATRNEFSGQMDDGTGNDVDNECKYTPWSLLWMLSNGASGQLNEGKGKNKRGKKPSGVKNGARQNQINKIDDIINALQIKNKSFKNGVKKVLLDVKNKDAETFDKLYSDIKNHQTEYALSASGTNPIKLIKNKVAQIKSGITNQQPQQQSQEQPQNQQHDQEVEQAFNDGQSGGGEGEQGGQVPNLISDDQVNGVIENIEKLSELTRQFESEMSKLKRARFSSRRRENLNEDYVESDENQGGQNNNQPQQPANGQQQQQNNGGQDVDIEQLAQKILDTWQAAMNNYSKFFGPAAKYIFIYPDDLEYEIRNLDANKDLDKKGRDWDSEEYFDEEENLQDAIDKAREEFGQQLKSKKWYNNPDVADMITNISNGIIGALKA